MPQTQKALVLAEKRGRLAVEVIPVKKPGPGEILIKIHAAALNPVDWKIPKYGILIDEYPFILGFDVAGEVEEVGEGATDFMKGDRVLCETDMEKDHGAYQQYVISLAATTAKIPANMSYDEASTVPLGLATAYSGLYAAFPFGLALEPPTSEISQGKYKDVPIVILGGSSSVGQYTIQLAKLSGFSPIITTASVKNGDSLKELGTTHVLDRNLSVEDLKIEIKKITSKPLEFVYDSISGGTQQTAVDIAAPAGRILQAVPQIVKATEGKEIAHVVATLRLPHNVELLEVLFHDRVFGLLEKGLIVKALVVNKKNGKPSVQLVPVEKPGPGQILIKVQAAALNPVDWKIQKYGILIEGYPFILGYDIAGEVEELGDGVLDFKKGDRVLCQTDLDNTHGGFQQYVISLAATTAKIPDNISYDEASTIPLGLATAYSGLYAAFPFGLALDPAMLEPAQSRYKDEPIFILGGSSSVGQYTIQLAKLSGFSPIITTASIKNTDTLKKLGATHVLDRNLSAEDLRIEVKKITLKPLEYLYDSISDGTYQTAIDLVAPGGWVILVQHPVVTATEGKQVAKAVAKLRLPHNLNLLETLYHDKIFGLLENGHITPNKLEVLPNGLEGIPDGLARLEAGSVSMLKLVAHPQESADMCT